MKAGDILTTAAELVGGDRQETHGDKAENHANIAAMWNAYLSIRRDPAAPLNAQDITHLMALLKVARTQLGASNIDDWTDGAAYLAIAGELSGD